MRSCACRLEKVPPSHCTPRDGCLLNAHRLLAFRTCSHTGRRHEMGSQARPGAMFLRISRDIEHVKRHGRRSSTLCFNLLASHTEGCVSQVGIIVGRRFGNAVKRNRSKRLFRELVRAIYPDLVPGFHLLVFPKRDALALSFCELKELWTTTLSKHRLLMSRST